MQTVTDFRVYQSARDYGQRVGIPQREAVREVASAEQVAEAREVLAAVEMLTAYAESALEYVDDAAAAERVRHRTNGAPNSQVVAQTVADNLRAALSTLSEGC